MIGDLISKFAARRNVSWRKCGINGEHQRPIFHRFEIIGGDTGADVMRKSIVKSNPLLRALCRSSKQ